MGNNSCLVETQTPRSLEAARGHPSRKVRDFRLCWKDHAKKMTANLSTQVVK